MVILRIFAGLLITVLALSLGMFIVTGDRRWLRFAVQSLIAALIILLIIFAFFAFERVVLLN